MNIHYKIQSQIHIFQACNKEELYPKLPRTDVLSPILTSRTDGENIAHRAEYCELRAHYYIWKNMKLKAHDLVGVFHYRRYLDFGDLVNVRKTMQRRGPYHFTGQPNPEIYTSSYLAEPLRCFDLVAPVAEYTGIPVWIRYAGEENHTLRELCVMRQVIAQKSPKYLSACDAYLNGTSEYYCNMFLMRWNIYQSYCAWLFNILEEIEIQLESSMHQCTMGYLGERLFGIYYTKIKQDGMLRCTEVPRIHFWIYDDETHNFKAEAYRVKLLPPGSRRRYLLRKLVKRERYKASEYSTYFNDCNSNL